MWKQNGPNPSYIQDPMIGLDWTKLMWSKTIPPRGKVQVDWAWEITKANNSNWNGEPDGNSYFQVVSDTPILASELVLRNSGVYTSSQTYSVTAVTGMSLKDGFRAGTSYFTHGDRPHVTLGFGWFTHLIVMNGTASYMIWDRDGSRMADAGNGQWPGVGAGTNGKIERDITLMLSKPATSLDGSITFSRTSEVPEPPEKSMLDWTIFGPTNPDGTASDAFRALVPPTQSVTSAVYPHVAEGAFALGQSFGTGLAIKDSDIPVCDACYPKPAVNHITVELWSADGRQLQTARFDLGAGTKIAKTLPEIFPAMAIPQFGGYVKSSGTKPFVSFGLYWVAKNGKLVAVSMIPQL